jgi:hypothetical protein
VTAYGALFGSLDAAGVQGQIGVLLFDVVHPAVRYAAVFASGHVEQEALVNTTVLFAGQNITWGVEGGSTFVDAKPTLIARTQAQLQF